ncbi:hypothetical protein [Natronosalvus caseinilyticus]|uniref:hypothetical protein n=1 Tax=Natronosalvus caseinilyticus TaxID=2953747 RepID=UPI0028AFDF83|nr:hypothetical protein [Natronosalvus caseinilyticus]
MNRRTVLVKFVVACSIPFSGCLSESSNEPSESTNPESDQNGSADETPEGRVDSVFIENLSETEARVEVVVQKENGDEILANAYRIPGSTGIEIPAVGIEGEEYDVSVQYDGVHKEDEWSVKDTWALFRRSNFRSAESIELVSPC